LDDSVGSGEEGEDLLNKPLLVSSQRLPIALILGKVNFLGRPERGDGLLVELVDLGLRILDRKQRVSLSGGCHSDVYTTQKVVKSFPPPKNNTMSVAPPPATYTATNDLNILKNIFVPQYQFSNGYYRASVNTQLPGNVTVGDTTTHFKMYVNGEPIMTLSDLQNWSFYYATSNLNMNSNSITTVSKLVCLGGNIASSYTIDATTGTINVSQYSLKSVPLTLSGGLPAWATYRASTNVTMGGYAISGLSALTMISGQGIVGPSGGAIVFSNASKETMRMTPSGMLGIGTTAEYTGYSLNVSGGSILQSPVRVINASGQLDSNSFFIQTKPSVGGNYDVRLGALGPGTNLYLCTGNGNGTLANEDQVKIDGVGNLKLMTGGAFSNTDVTVPNKIGGVVLQNSTVTAVMNISVGDFSTLTLKSSVSSGTTFIVTSATDNTINLTLSAANLAKGTYWVVKNAVGSAQTVTVAGGTIVNTLSVLASNAMTTIVYSGTGSNYYAL
jgi:hypothetical protein